MFRTLLPIVASALLISVYPQPAAAAQRSADRSGGKPAATTVVNINTAAPADFESLPGIGAKTAARIVEYRQKNGPFKKIEELMNVRGIGEKNFLKLKGQLTVATAKSDHNPQQQ